MPSASPLQGLPLTSGRFWATGTSTCSSSTGWCTNWAVLTMWVLLPAPESSLMSLSFRLVSTLSEFCLPRWADWERFCLEASLSGFGNPRAQLSCWLQRQMCLPQVRTDTPQLESFQNAKSSSRLAFHLCVINSERRRCVGVRTLWSSKIKLWKILLDVLNVSSRRYLYGFEEYCTSTAITFKMDLPLKQGTKGEGKPEGEAGKTAPTSSVAEEPKAQVDGEPCSTQPVICKVHYPECCLLF